MSQTDTNQMVEALKASVPFARHAHVTVIAGDLSGASALPPGASSPLNHVGREHHGALFTAGESASGAATMVVESSLRSRAN